MTTAFESPMDVVNRYNLHSRSLRYQHTSLSRVIQRADDGIGVCPLPTGLLYPVRTSKYRKRHEIEMVRQNVKKVAADRRSNFIISQSSFVSNEKCRYENISRIPYLGYEFKGDCVQTQIYRY